MKASKNPITTAFVVVETQIDMSLPSISFVLTLWQFYISRMYADARVRANANVRAQYIRVLCSPKIVLTFFELFACEFHEHTLPITLPNEMYGVIFLSFFLF